MAKIQVEVIDLQSSQRSVACFDDMLTIQPFLVRPIAAPKHLARDHKSIARPSFLFQDVAHHDLGPTFSVGFGVIEKVRAAIVSDRHQFFGRLVADLLRERDPGAKGELAKL